LFALSAILKEGGGVRFDRNLIRHPLTKFPRFSEWAQSELRQAISQYTPENNAERFDLMNIVDQPSS
jgi:hypothetical protein